jgi:hypothetical protein
VRTYSEERPFDAVVGRLILLADALRAADAVMLPPTLVGAWGRARR